MSENSVARLMYRRIACPVGIVLWIAVSLGGCGKDVEPPMEGDTADILAIKKMGGKVGFATFDISPDAQRSVDFTGTSVSDGDLKLLEKIDVLTLNLEKTDITDAGLDAIIGLQQLNTLNLSGTKITNAGLEKLQGIELMSLDVGNTAITDDGLKYLKEMTSLNKLHVYNTAVTDAGMEHLKNLKGVVIFSLGGTKVTPQGARKLQDAVPGAKLFGIRVGS